METGQIYKETKWLTFAIVGDTGKTVKVAIIPKDTKKSIGFISWFSPWRRYSFFPFQDTIWESTCLQDVLSVINELMEERKKKGKK